MKFYKRAMGMIILLGVICLNTITVQAVTFDNDGSAKEVPYGDSKLPSTIDGSTYVDCYLPYKLTPGDIGGYATGATQAGTIITTGGGQAMPDYIVNAPVATVVTKEAPYNYAVSHGWATTRMANPTGLPVTSHPETGLDVITDTNGAQYYLTAVQPWFFNHPKAGQESFPSDASTGRGEIIDVILTDGTCIHFVCLDINAAQHTNGSDSSGEGAFDYIYTNSELKLKQYNNMFSTQNGNTLEIWGTSDNIPSVFKEKYNLGKEEGQNKIAYYRMYNQFVWDSPKRASGVGNEVSFSYGEVNISSSAGKEEGNVDNSIISEWELQGMPEQSKLGEKQGTVKLPERGNLGLGEAYSVQMVKDDIETSNVALAYTNARVAVVFVGLFMVFYSVLLLLSFMFDKANQFIEISLIKIISFGFLEYSDDDTSKGEVGYVSTGRILIIIVVICIIGLLLISGGVLPFMMELTRSIYQKFS